MVNTKCIRYSVDPGLLSEGKSIESLERKNEQVLGEPKQLNSYVQGAILRHNKGVELPKPPDKLEIELGISDYSKVKAGKLIKISPEVAKHNGEKFKIRNRGTTSYVVRTLVRVGDAKGGKLRGWFR